MLSSKIAKIVIFGLNVELPVPKHLKPEKGWNESQRLFCDSRMSGTEPTNDPMVRNGNIALLAKWAVEPKTRL